MDYLIKFMYYLGKIRIHKYECDNISLSHPFFRIYIINFLFILILSLQFSIFLLCELSYFFVLCFYCLNFFFGIIFFHVIYLIKSSFL